MKNWLVIHNENIPRSLLKDFKEGQQDVLEFDITPALQMNESFSFDYETAEILKNHFSNKKKYDCIFIPYNLNKELYLDFSGLKVAFHIRLSPELDHTFCPIVFYGYENPLHVAKLSQYSKILFSIGSLTLTSSKISFENFNLTCDYLKEMTHEDYVNFLNELNIIPADDYKSHHSTANELALFQWSTFIGCDDQIDEVKVNRNRLYFKYLEAKRVFNADVGWGSEIDYNDFEPPEIIINGNIKKGKDKEGKPKYRLAKVLLIDDEAKKGWDSFYANLFKLNPVEEERVVFDSLKLQDKKGKEIKFKNSNREQILEAAIKKVVEFDPDIVLLDLRLQDDDFKQEVSPNELTGIQILRGIEKINRGTQVIITSASNKIWNYEASEKTGLGVDGYIIKSDDENPEESVKRICKKVTELLPKADFLKAVEKRMISIKQLFPVKDSEDYIKNNSFYSNSSINIEVAFKLLNDSIINKKYSSFGFLQLFMILEDFVKRKDVCCLYKKKFVVTNGDSEVIVVKRDEKISCIKLEDITKGEIFFSNIYFLGEAIFDHWIDTNLKISSVLIFRNGLPNANKYKWPELRDLRNAIAHGNDEIENKDVLDLLDLLLFVLNNANLKETNVNKGLKNKSASEKLNDLENKFKKY
jgi:CheY-like chemotaxis protein